MLNYSVAELRINTGFIVIRLVLCIKCPPMYKTKEGHFIYYSSFANSEVIEVKGVIAPYGR